MFLPIFVNEIAAVPFELFLPFKNQKLNNSAFDVVCTKNAKLF